MAGTSGETPNRFSPVAGRKGSVVIRRRTDQDCNGHAIFEIFMEAKPPNFAPTGEKIVSLEVEGFEELSCNGRKKCAQHKRLPANTNHKPLDQR